MTPEIQALGQRLRLSDGDLLALAREVSENGTLLSVDHLTVWQRRQLVTLLHFLAQPVTIPASIDEFEALYTMTA